MFKRVTLRFEKIRLESDEKLRDLERKLQADPSDSAAREMLHSAKERLGANRKELLIDKLKHGLYRSRQHNLAKASSYTPEQLRKTHQILTKRADKLFTASNQEKRPVRSKLLRTLASRAIYRRNALTSKPPRDDFEHWKNSLTDVRSKGRDLQIARHLGARNPQHVKDFTDYFAGKRKVLPNKLQRILKLKEPPQ